MDEYTRMLNRFDWFFEYSDDPSQVRRAREELVTMYKLQEKFDPSGEVWNHYKPSGQVSVPQPR
jgi:hypothetical protein